MQSNENMETTSTLQSEQHIKKELAKKLGQLQEKLGELKETVTAAPVEGLGDRHQPLGSEGPGARTGDPRVLQSL